MTIKKRILLVFTSFLLLGSTQAMITRAKKQKTDTANGAFLALIECDPYFFVTEILMYFGELKDLLPLRPTCRAWNEKVLQRCDFYQRGDKKMHVKLWGKKLETPKNTPLPLAIVLYPVRGYGHHSNELLKKMVQNAHLKEKTTRFSFEYENTCRCGKHFEKHYIHFPHEYAKNLYQFITSLRNLKILHLSFACSEITEPDTFAITNNTQLFDHIASLENLKELTIEIWRITYDQWQKIANSPPIQKNLVFLSLILFDKQKPNPSHACGVFRGLGLIKNFKKLQCLRICWERDESPSLKREDWRMITDIFKRRCSALCSNRENEAEELQELRRNLRQTYLDWLARTEKTKIIDEGPYGNDGWSELANSEDLQENVTVFTCDYIPVKDLLEIVMNFKNLKTVRSLYYQPHSSLFEDDEDPLCCNPNGYSGRRKSIQPWHLESSTEGLDILRLIAERGIKLKAKGSKICR